MRAQLVRYEQLRDGRITRRDLDSLREQPTALIEARIAGVGVERLQDIADALGSRIREHVTYSSAA